MILVYFFLFHLVYAYIMYIRLKIIHKKLDFLTHCQTVFGTDSVSEICFDVLYHQENWCCLKQKFKANVSFKGR